MTINDIYINKEMEMNGTIMDWIVDNKIMIKIYIATKYIIESLATFIGSLMLYACFRFMVNLMWLNININRDQLAPIFGVVFTAIMVTGIIVGSYTIMTSIADRFEELKMEKNELIQQLNMANNLNAELIERILESDTFGKSIAKMDMDPDTFGKMDSEDSVDL